MVPVAPIITGITFVFTLHMRSISIVRSLYFITFLVSFFIYYYYYYYYYYYSLLCRVFTIGFQEQTMFPGNIFLQLFCSHNYGYM
jgi:hypothetical protein